MINRLSYTRHIYKVSSVQTSNVFYELTDYYNGCKKLTENIRIERFRGYSNSKKNDRYVRVKNNPLWKDCTMLTGLRKTPKPNVFFGDSIINKKSLVIFQFSDDKTTLVVDVFNGFYPIKYALLTNIIKSHNYEL